MKKRLKQLKKEDKALQKLQKIDKEPDYNEIIKVNYKTEYADYHQEVKQEIKDLKNIYKGY